MVALGYANLTKEGFVAHVSRTESDQPSTSLNNSDNLSHEVQGQV